MSRLAKAIAIVAALVLAAPVSQLAFGGTVDASVAPQASLGLDAASLLEGGDPEAVLARLEDAAAIGQEAPQWFQRELALPSGARDVRTSGSVVSFIVEGESGQVLERVKALMAAKGWTCVPLGQAEGATFLKKTGSCTWAIATCTQIGSATSVVFRCDIS